MTFHLLLTTDESAQTNTQKRCEGNLLRKCQTRYCVLSPKGFTYVKCKEEVNSKVALEKFIPSANLKQCSVTGLEILIQAQVVRFLLAFVYLVF